MISIVIPTYNEAVNILSLIRFLTQYGGNDVEQIIVSDGGSEDDTCAVAVNAGATVLVSPLKGRAVQMNYGASRATGSILYFVHADCRPPASFVTDIREAMSNGFDLGRYRTQFDSYKKILKINAYFTRFDFFICSGGDQTLFISNSLFHRLGGFNQEMQIMEDYDLVTRAKQVARFAIIQKDVLVSARKYDGNSWLAVQWANYRIVKMYKQGASQQEMTEKYKQLLHYR